jgi:hypothetical protein
MKVGKPAAAVMFGMSRASIMVYNGQEIGEPAIGAEGFSGDDGRTSIFDYTAMPEFQKWVNGGKFDGGGLSLEQRDLRKWYAGLFQVLKEPAFECGEFFGLNYANREKPEFGHWIYAFLRQDALSGQAFLCVANFHPDQDIPVKVRVSSEALGFIQKSPSTDIFCRERLANHEEIKVSGNILLYDGLDIGILPSCESHYYELK